MVNPGVKEMTLKEALNFFGYEKCPDAEIEVDKKFKELVRKWHPDLHPENKEECEKMTKAINQARDRMKKAIANGEHEINKDTEKTNNDVVEQCQMCNGTGKMNKMVRVPGGSHAVKKVKCDYCRGTGKKVK